MTPAHALPNRALLAAIDFPRDSVIATRTMAAFSLSSVFVLFAFAMIALIRAARLPPTGAIGASGANGGILSTAAYGAAAASAGGASGAAAASAGGAVSSAATRATSASRSLNRATCSSLRLIIISLNTRKSDTLISCSVTVFRRESKALLAAKAAANSSVVTSTSNRCTARSVSTRSLKALCTSVYSSLLSSGFGRSKMAQFSMMKF
mmetsp:Transcript_83056/g.151918  ORF Transcript_83056/g.151918 Transcript_83056/m.151918 type:complete len:208 (-) Transcript_83056:157-780(-)